MPRRKKLADSNLELQVKFAGRPIIGGPATANPKSRKEITFSDIKGHQKTTLRGGKNGNTRRKIRSAFSAIKKWWNSLDMDSILGLKKQVEEKPAEPEDPAPEPPTEPAPEPPSIMEDGDVEDKGEKGYNPNDYMTDEEGPGDIEVIADQTNPVVVTEEPEPPPTVKGIGAEPLGENDDDGNVYESSEFEKQLQEAKNKLKPVKPNEEKQKGPSYLDDDDIAKILKRRVAIGEGFGIINHHPLLRKRKTLTNMVIPKKHLPRIIF